MPLQFISEQPILFMAWLLAIVIALSVHEFSHAAIGSLLGDNTAKAAGRLTLNPLAHIDPIGFLMLILIGFGWGKPVPINPYNLKYPRWGSSFVAFAGPLSNLISVVVFGVILKALLEFGQLPAENLLMQFLVFLVIVNLLLFLFNLLPIPPLDGSKFLLSALAGPRFVKARFLLETRGPFLLLVMILLDSLFGINIFGRIFGGVIDSVFQFFA